MRTISGIFASQEDADKAVDALEAAGVESEMISTEVPDDSSEIILSARVENENADAANAILSQAGASSVEDTETDADGSFDDVQDEEVARLREPRPIVTPFR